MNLIVQKTECLSLVQRMIGSVNFGLIALRVGI